MRSSGSTPPRTPTSIAACTSSASRPPSPTSGAGPASASSSTRARTARSSSSAAPPRRSTWSPTRTAAPSSARETRSSSRSSSTTPTSCRGSGCARAAGPGCGSFPWTMPASSPSTSTRSCCASPRGWWRWRMHRTPWERCCRSRTSCGAPTTRAPTCCWTARRRSRTSRWTCRTWTAISTPSRGTRCSARPGSASSTGARRCWSRCPRTRAAAMLGVPASYLCGRSA